MLLFLACTSEGTERPSEPDAPDTSADSSPADTTDSSGGDTADSSGGDTATAPPPTLTLGKAVRPMGLYSGLATTEEETRALVAEAADGGFGTFIPSVGGYTVWWNTTEADLDADYADALAGGVDLLQVAIDEAHARGLAVVPSVAVFPSPPLYATDPSWITRDRDGTPNSSYALAFSDPDARAAKLPLLLDLVCNYDVDGVFLDYTRYPGDDWGFDDPLLAAATAEGLDRKSTRLNSSHSSVSRMPSSA